MTETTKPSPEAAPAEAPPLNPADILLNLIITLLAPMFLVVSGGDILFARMAALQTVDAYCARNEADLITIAQIIGFGLAALGSLSLSMADDLSVSMTLRLRANANACNRSAEQNRRALKESRPGTSVPAIIPPASTADLNGGFDEAEVLASVAAAQKRATEAKSNLQDAAPVAEQAPVPAPVPAIAAPMIVELQHQAMWAAAAADVAAELTADLSTLPPAERRAAMIRAAALSGCANDLLSGKVAPRLRPSDVAGTTGPNAA